MSKPSPSELGLHVIAKPIGPVCNLRCDYCFYLEKESLYGPKEPWKMSDETLEPFVRQYLEAQPPDADVIDFAFQGGEPTLMGIDFYRRVLELQAKYASDRTVQNAIQTNGVLLDDRWCEFLRDNHFLVGLSLDGPDELHDKYRRDTQGRGTFDQVFQSLQRLEKHGVEFNVLCCVNRHNGNHPKRVYQFFRDAGIRFLQFIPIVERRTEVAIYGDPGSAKPDSLVGSRSVRPGQFGRFLSDVFDAWLERDVGEVFVRDFDQALGAWLGAGASLCVYAEACGRATAIEHNGDLYSCDHFVTPEHKLGNIHQQPIREMANGPKQIQFGRDKSARLPQKCRRCRFRFICNGACPKDRFLRTPDGEPGLNYLCDGFMKFFTHIDPTMKAMAAELQAGRPAAGVMRQVRAERQRKREASAAGPVRRNDPCPCGSGKKFKHCCLRRSVT